jgi:hypothetical protein
MKFFLTALSFVASLSIFSVHAATSAESPQGFLKGVLPDNTAALKRVAITTFFVQYVTHQSVEAKGSEVFYAQWDGVSPALMQATANALYLQLTEDFKAAGIEVVPAAEVEAQPSLAELRQAGSKNLSVVNDSTLWKTSTLVSANDLPIVLTPLADVRLGQYATTTAEGTNQPLIGADNLLKRWLVPGGEVSNLVTIYGNQSKLAESLKATTMGVRLVVPLINIGVQRKVGGFGVGILEGGHYGLAQPNARFVEAGTVFAFSQAGGNPGHLHAMGLQKPVPISGLKIEIVQTDRYRDRSAFRQKDGGLFGALGRAAGTNNNAPHLLVKLDPADFQQSLVGAGSTIFKEMAQTLAAPR